MRRIAKLPTTSYALLGLLSAAPMSGYELAQAVDRSINYFWPISKSQIYSELPRLEGLGLLVGDDVAQERVPDKRVYRITDAGEAELAAWVNTPRRERDRFRSELLVKVFFAPKIETERLRAMISEYKAVVEDERAYHAEVVARLEGIAEAAGARAAALMGLRIYDAIIGWAEEVLSDVPAPEHEHSPDEIAAGAKRIFASLTPLPPKRRSP